jgi:ligand-binding sensor domain-containing protein
MLTAWPRVHPMNKGRIIFALFFALVFTNGAASALDPDFRISQYGHVAWWMEDGAFNGTPRVITQTQDGYIWIGTSDGLARFDGVRFGAWRPPKDSPLPSSSIYSLLGSSDGSLWIGTAAGLARWKDNKQYSIHSVVFDGEEYKIWGHNVTIFGLIRWDTNQNTKQNAERVK